MDVLSRLLANIGQSLGRGLTQVGQTELQKQANLEGIGAQARAQMGVNVLNELLKAPASVGFALLSPEEQTAVNEAIVRLSTGDYSPETISKALSTLSLVAQRNQEVETYKRLYERGELPIFLASGAVPEEQGKRILQLVGIDPGLYPAIVENGSMLRRARELGIQAQEADIERAKAQAQSYLAQAGLTEEERNRLRQLLPLTLIEAERKNELLKQQLQKGEIDLKNYEERLRAEIRETLSRAGLNEAQTKRVLELIEPEVQRLKAEATEAGARTELIREQTESQRLANEITRQYGLDERKASLVERVFNLVKTNPDLTDEAIRALIPDSFGDAKNPIAQAAIGLRDRIKRVADLQMTDEEAKFLGNLSDLLSQGKIPPEVARELIRDRVKSSYEGLSPEEQEKVVAFYENQARLGSFLRSQGIGNQLVQEYLKLPPPKTRAEESQALRGIWDTLNAQYGPNTANRVVNAIKAGWEFNRISQSLNLKDKETQIAFQKAQTEYYNILSQTKPKELALDEKRFEHQKAIDWAKIALGQRELDLREKELNWRTAAQTAEGVGLKDLATVAKGAYEVYERALAAALERRGAVDCANAVRSSGASLLTNAGAIVTGASDKCGNAIEEVTRNDPNVARAHQAAISAQNLLAGALNSLAPLPGEYSGGGGGTGGGGMGGGSGATPPSGPSATRRSGPAVAYTRSSGVQITRQNLVEAPDKVQRAVAKTQASPAAVGFAAVVWPGEGGGADNPLQLIHGDPRDPNSLRARGQACAQRYSGDPTAIALCQARVMLQERRYAPNTPFWLAAAGHHLPSAAVSENIPYTNEFKRQNPAIARIAATRRGMRADDPAKVPVDGKDVRAYYALHALDALFDKVFLPKMPKEIRMGSWNDLGDDKKMLVAYALANLSSAAVNTRVAQGAVRRAMIDLGVSIPPQGEKVMAQLVETIAKNGTLGQIGSALMSQYARR